MLSLWTGRSIQQRTENIGLDLRKKGWVWRSKFLMLDRATFSSSKVQKGNPVVRRLRLQLWEVTCIILGTSIMIGVFKGPIQEGGRYTVFRKSWVRNQSPPIHPLNPFSTCLLLRSILHRAVYPKHEYNHALKNLWCTLSPTRWKISYSANHLKPFHYLSKLISTFSPVLTLATMSYLKFPKLVWVSHTDE